MFHGTLEDNIDISGNMSDVSAREVDRSTNFDFLSSPGLSLLVEQPTEYLVKIGEESYGS